MRVPYIDPIHRRYAAGMAVKIFYDPRDLTRRVVEPGAPALAVLADAFVSIVTFAVGGSGLFYGLRRP